MGFNGAAFFQSGKCISDGRESASEVASMEPLFFKAENLAIDWAASVVTGRLQWSRFFSKRKIFGVGYKRRQRFASMEPLFFKAENKKVAIATQERWEASMEPLFFKAEN